jgi:hypothetical protein
MKYKDHLFKHHLTSLLLNFGNYWQNPMIFRVKLQEFILDLLFLSFSVIIKVISQLVLDNAMQPIHKDKAIN